LGLQWQWHTNPTSYWSFLNGNALRLFSYQVDSTKNLWHTPNLLLQKFPAEEFTVTTKVLFKPRITGEKIGFVIMGGDYAYMSLFKKTDAIYLTYNTCKQAEKGSVENEKIISKFNGEIYFRVRITKGALCEFGYSTDGISFNYVDQEFTAQPGKWIGAKVGFFCTRTTKTNDSGWADIDWFRVEP
jgi:hypothetical protein